MYCGVDFRYMCLISSKQMFIATPVHITEGVGYVELVT